ncbi:MAG: DUF5996 family protein [Betaproteobacteria bacterium]
MAEPASPLDTPDCWPAFRLAEWQATCDTLHMWTTIVGKVRLAVTRFSGRPARAGADAVTREAYSHEVSSVGFWPGSGTVTDAAFYAYTVPEPREMRERRIEPAAARYHPELGEYVLTYDAVRTAPSPTAALLAFCESTYAAGASAGGWDREALDRERSGMTRSRG